MSSCLGVLLELQIPDLLAKEDIPIALEDVSPLFVMQWEGTLYMSSVEDHADCMCKLPVVQAKSRSHIVAQMQCFVLQLAEKAGVTEAGLDSFYKVLRVMAQYDMLDEHTDRKFSSNVATSLLVRGKEPSLGHMAAHQINTPKMQAWQVLPEAVRTGKTAFTLAHHGDTMYQVRLSYLYILCMSSTIVYTCLAPVVSFFEHMLVAVVSIKLVLFKLTMCYAHVCKQSLCFASYQPFNSVQYGEKHDNAAFGSEFMQSMTYFTRHSLQGGSQSLKESYDWKSVKCIMDVGGGRGELLSSCMSWAAVNVQGLLFDREYVIKG